MRFGVDGACWANARGYGRFTRELLGAAIVEAPDDEWVFFVDRAAHEAFDLCAANVRLVDVPQGVAPTVAAAAGGRRSLRDMLAFTKAVWREQPDVFFSPSVYTYFPLPPRLPAVVAIHDTIAERHPELTLPSRQARLAWAAKVRLALLQCRIVVTVSDYSARELSEVLRVPAQRIRVVGEAPSAVFNPAPPEECARAAACLGLPTGARWVVYVGGFGPHKNVDDVVRAHAAAARTSPAPLHLLLVGDADADPFYSDVARIVAAVETERTGPLVTWTGYLPDDQLRPLLAGADALLLPSEREGFGLPAVEAAACGTPVIATQQSPLPQLLDGGGFFVAPGDLAGLTDALVALVSDTALREVMGARARERAAALSWGAGAAVAVAAVREAAR